MIVAVNTKSRKRDKMWIITTASGDTFTLDAGDKQEAIDKAKKRGYAVKTAVRVVDYIED